MLRSACSFLALSLMIAPAVSPALAHGPHLPAAQAAPPAIVTETDLGDGLYMLQGRGGNIGLLSGPDGAFVIDSQFADMSPANLGVIERLADGAPRFLVNTHWHGDHTGGNEAFAGTGATILAHDNVRARVSTRQVRNFNGNDRVTEASPAAAWPVMTFAAGMTLHLNGQTIEVFHVPNAHTDGDAIIHFVEADVIHMGDVMFSGAFPYIDRSSGGTVAGYIAALDMAYELADADTRIIPGHGQLSNRDDVKALADVLRKSVAAIQPLVDQGMTRDEVIDAAPLSDLAEAWANRFMTEPVFTGILYDDVSGATEG